MIYGAYKGRDGGGLGDAVTELGDLGNFLALKCFYIG